MRSARVRSDIQSSNSSWKAPSSTRRKTPPVKWKRTPRTPQPQILASMAHQDRVVSHSHGTIAAKRRTLNPKTANRHMALRSSVSSTIWKEIDATTKGDEGIYSRQHTSTKHTPGLIRKESNVQIGELQRYRRYGSPRTLGDTFSTFVACTRHRALNDSSWREMASLDKGCLTPYKRQTSTTER